MADKSALAVTLTVEQLESLVRSVVRAEVADASVAVNEVMNLTQVAELLQRHPKVVMKLVHSDELPVTYISEREPRFFRSKVMAWLASRPIPQRKAS